MKPRNATDERDTIPTVCSASIVSLNVSATTIAVGAVSFLTCLMHFAINSTILSNEDLCIMQCCCLVDLLANEIQCVHCYSPEILGWVLISRSFSRLRLRRDERSVPRLTCVRVASDERRSIIDLIFYVVKWYCNIWYNSKRIVF